MLTFVAALSLPLSLPTLPDNGAYTLACPVETLVVDGDLADWPAETRSVPFERSHTKQLYGTDDFEARMRVAYSVEEGRLYVAVEGTDDSRVVGYPGSRDQDLHILTVDRRHAQRGSAPRSWACDGEECFVFAEPEVNYYRTWEASSWDPDVAPATTEGVECVGKRAGSRFVYEWSVELGTAVEADRTLGLDYTVLDKDAGDPPGEHSHLTWGPWIHKERQAGRVGDVLLARDEKLLGTLTGALRLDGMTPRWPHDRVRIASVEKPRLWTQVRADESGVFRVELPAGAYVVQPVSRRLETENGFVQLDAGVEVPVVVNAQASTQAAALEVAVRAEPELPQLERGWLLDFDSERLAEVDRFVEIWREHYDIPGLSLGLVRKGRLVHHGTYGVTNALTQEPVTATTLFEAGSLTKAVFAFAVLRLAQDRRLYLDDPLSEVLKHPAVGADERAQEITARFVLSHQTGLPNWAGQSAELAFAPGNGFRYSGEGFNYLEDALERLTGKASEHWMRTEALEPLGIEQGTYFSATEGLVERLAVGHWGDVPEANSIPTRAHSAYSMMTEAQAFSGFLIGLMQREALEPKYYEALLGPQVDTGDSFEVYGGRWPKQWGLGVQLLDSPLGRVYGHSGSTGSHSCNFEVYDELDLGFVVFTNNDRAMDLSRALRAFLITGTAG